MSEKSELMLALMLPVIAVGWVIADAAMGLAAADRESASWTVFSPPPLVQIVSGTQAISTTGSRKFQGPVVICAADGTVGTGFANPQPRGLSQSSLQRLCRAGLKFTSSLPKT